MAKVSTRFSGQSEFSQRSSVAPKRQSAHALAEGIEARISVTPLAEAEDKADKDDAKLLLAQLLAEATGTFFLVFTVGVAVTSGTQLAAVAIGLTLGIQIYTFGSVSGGLFNPAVTFAVCLSGRGKISPKKATLYVCMQFVGGIIAGLAAAGATGKSFYFHWEKSSAGSMESSLLLEVLFTAALCNAVLATGTSSECPNQYFGFAIGCSVLASALACGNFDQGSFNPAVTFGINLAHVMLDSEGGSSPSAGAWALFLLAPLLGGVLAASIFRCTRSREYENRGEEGPQIILLREKLFAEVTGTFYLVLTVGTVVPGGSSLAPVAIGLMLGVQIYTFGGVSGGLFNPAVVLAVVLSGREKLPLRPALWYATAEILSAAAAGFMAFGITNDTFFFDYTLTPAGGSGSSFALETLFTAALCGAVLATGTSLDAPNHYFGFAIGGMVLAAVATCGAFDQGSFNPAVTWGINLANVVNADAFGEPSGGAWCVFIFAPCLGGMLAAGIFRGVRIVEYRQRPYVSEVKDRMEHHQRLSEAKDKTESGGPTDKE
mmetsp:Transcript_87657/g.203921  ORF Transcript_87657/g.203921 Transcript_87657/m.203921 type:complete len:546 (+) Transcript_87657:33-1670(+)